MHQQHQPAPIPNAADDPFGAMNAMAAVGTVQRAPEIVIVNDGRPVENVGQKSTGARVAMIAIPGEIALVLGVWVGTIGAGASDYNSGLDDAKVLLGDKTTPSTIAALKQTLSDIDTVLDEARTKNSFRPDASTDKKLEALAGKLVIDNKLFRRKQAALKGETIEQVMMFYGGVAEVKAMIDIHTRMAKIDTKAFNKAKDGETAATVKESEIKGLTGQLRYAIVVAAPTDSDPGEFGARLVELTGVFCGAANAPSSRCADGESAAVAYRAELIDKYAKGEIATPGPDSVPTKKILPLLPGGVRDQFFKGAEGVASEVYYQRRLRALYERICKREDGKCAPNTLLKYGNEVETNVDSESKQGTRFSFFM